MNLVYIIHNFKCNLVQLVLYTIRIYNPIKQSSDQDPSGDFIRRWVPELSEIKTPLMTDIFWKLSPIELV